MICIDLSNKTAVVTGASQGLGAATAAWLHRAGASVVVNYFDDPDGANRRNAETVAAELGDRAVIAAGDVRKLDDMHAVMQQAVDAFGSLDVVVNNAAVLRDRTVAKMSSDEWRSVIDTNLSGVFHAAKAAAERMADGGRIVNMASVAAVIGFFGQANYAAAKSGVMALTKVLSRELARRKITVNAVAPGVVLTEMGRSIPEKAREQMLAAVPLGRFAEPDEIAAVILFLASDLSSYVTGQTIHVNGGWW